MLPDRLPFQPVWDIMRVRHGTPTLDDYPKSFQSADLWSNTTAARWLHVTPSRVKRWWTTGMTLDEADKACTELALHGRQVWGDLFLEVADLPPGSTGGRSAGPVCVNGHEFTPENTYVRASGKRDCRECRRVRDARKKTAA